MPQAPVATDTPTALDTPVSIDPSVSLDPPATADLAPAVPVAEINDAPVASGTPLPPAVETTSGSVTFPDNFILDPSNDSVEASRVEGIDIVSGDDLTGAGVSVGIISDSFNALGGQEADIASGDLPSNVRLLNDAETGTDEGRALAQIIHDIAPGADLAFASFGSGGARALDPRELRVPNGGVLAANRASIVDRGNNSTDLDLAQSIEDLVEEGVDIIIDDVVPVTGPVFQRGFEAQAQEAAIEAGVSIFQSAGNRGTGSAEVSFSGNPGDFVDFDPDTPGVQGIPRVYAPGQRIETVLHWDDPYQSVTPDGTLTADFDLFFLANDSVVDNENQSNNVLLPGILGNEAFSLSEGNQLLEIDSSETGLDPFERIEMLNSNGDNGLPIEGEWHVRFAGGASVNEDGSDRTVRVTFFDEAATDLDLPNPLGANLGATSENSNNVGAVNGLNGQLQQLSSVGPNRLLFDDQGQRLPESEQIQVGVDFVAPDNVNTTFFGSDSPLDPDDFPNFAGTSASSAVAAGVGALVLQANPNASPAQVTEFLTTTATGIADPVSTDPALDRAGAGLINADDATLEAQFAAQ